MWPLFCRMLQSSGKSFNLKRRTPVNLKRFLRGSLIAADPCDDLSSNINFDIVSFEPCHASPFWPLPMDYHSVISTAPSEAVFCTTLLEQWSFFYLCILKTSPSWSASGCRWNRASYFWPFALLRKLREGKRAFMLNFPIREIQIEV